MATGFMRRMMVTLGLDDEEVDDYDSAYEQEAAVSSHAPRRSTPEAAPTVVTETPRAIRPLPRDDAPDPIGPVVATRPRPVTVAPSPKVHVVAPERFADAQEIGDRFKSGQPVIVNLQVGGDPALSRRMIDFCSGVAYALGGSMDRVADQVFLLTPSNVEVSAEEKRRLKDQGLYRS